MAESTSTEIVVSERSAAWPWDTCPDCGRGPGLVHSVSCGIHDRVERPDAISDFLHHAAERDLPDAELFELKARAFDAMADKFDQDGDTSHAASCRRFAMEARAAAARVGEL